MKGFLLTPDWFNGLFCGVGVTIFLYGAVAHDPVLIASAVPFFCAWCVWIIAR